MTSKMKIFKDFDFQQSFRYRAPRNSTQGRRLAMYVLDLGLSTDILKGKGTLTFSVKDVFNSQLGRREVELENFYSYSEGRWRAGRMIILNFVYRLNQKKSRRGGRGGGDGMDLSLIHI